MTGASNPIDDFSPVKRALLAVKDLQAKLDALERARTEPIAIVGMGCRFPGGADSPAAFWELLRAGVDAVREVPRDRWDIDAYYDPDPTVAGKMATRWGGFLDQVDKFDPEFFGISPREAARMDPQHRLLLEVAWEAIECAALPSNRIAGTRAGVFVGIYNNDYAQLQGGSHADAHVALGNSLGIAAGRLSYLLDLHGPSMLIDTLCSSSLVAVHLACQSLRAGECDLALAGGVNVILSPASMMMTSRLLAMAPDGRCKTFDARADGFVRGEGCGVVVLKRLADAIRDGDSIWAVVRGSAVNQDGRSTDLTAPNALAQQAVMRQALSQAQLAPEAVGYVEAHGTGTALGDPIEVAALSAVYGQPRLDGARCLLGSVKTNLGHLEAAAGIAGLIKAVLILRQGSIPPHLHFRRLNPRITLTGTPFAIPTALTPWPANGQPRRAAVSAFGMSGTNAHLILEEAPSLPSTLAATAVGPAREPQVLTLSARTPAALADLAGRYGRFLAAPEAPDWAAVCATSHQGRSHFSQRLALLAPDAPTAASRLQTWQSTGHAPGVHTGIAQSGPKVAFLFPGQGVPLAQVGQALYAHYPVFRDALDNCAARLAPYLEANLAAVLLAPAGSELAGRLELTAFIQPALVALEWALCEQLAAWGVRPNAVLGHSVGEYAAVVVAGVLELGDALRLAAERGRLMQALPAGGAMTSVEADEGWVRDLLARLGSAAEIAAVNAPRRVVVAGAAGEVAAVESACAAAGVGARRLKVGHAFHSRLMEPMQSQFAKALQGVAYRPAHVALVSGQWGRALAAGEVLDAGYWSEQVRQPVRYAAGVDALANLGCDVLVEVGPGAQLSGLGQMGWTENRPAMWVSPLRGKPDELGGVLAGLGQLYNAGMPIDWAVVDGPGARRIVLPTYPFQRTRYWVDPVEPPAANVELAKSDGRLADDSALPGRRLETALDGDVYETTLSVRRLPFLRDHQLLGEHVVPGAYYVVLALAAGRRGFSAPCRLDDVLFEQLLTVSEDNTRTLQVIVTSGSSTDGQDVRIFSRGETETWVLHARGRLGDGPQEPAPVYESLTQVQARCRELVDPSDLYAAVESRGLELGASMRWIQELWRGDGEALARISAPEAVRGLDPRHHPGLVDACLQVAGATLPLADQNVGLYLPLGIDAVQDWNQPLGQAIFVHARLRPAESGSATRSADVTLVDADGRALLRLSGVTLAPAPRNAVAAERPAPLFALGWQSLPLPASGPEAVLGRWLMIGDGPSNIFAQALSSALQDAGQQAQQLTLEQASASLRALDGARPANGARPVDGPRLAGIVVLTGLDATNPTPASIAQLLPLELLHGLLALPDPPRLWLLSHGSQSPGPLAPTPRPLQALRAGLALALAHEHPALRATLLDLDPALPLPAQAPAVAQILLAPDAPAEPRQALRGLSRVVPRLAPLPPAPGLPLQLTLPRSGSLDELTLTPLTRQPPPAGMVELAVYAAGLNFRDVLSALGQLPDGAGPLGGECAGRVVAVGAGVSGLAVGQRVVALAAGSLATHVTVPAELVAPIPPGLDWASAAGLPIAMLTARLALQETAQLRAGQVVLIHSAAGGVGLAALQVARAAGAVVVGSAGSAGKRALLRELGVAAVADSRDPSSYAAAVAAASGGRGVDVVLNALSGEAIGASLDLLAAGGIFVELGKRGIWSAAAVAERRGDARYAVVDLLGLTQAEPGRVGRWLRELVAGVGDGTLQALPVRTWALGDAARAFRTLAQGQQVGKLVLVPGQPPAGELVRGEGSYLITGGHGALGLAAAEWLVGQGAKHIALLSRSGADAGRAAAIERLRAGGAQVLELRADLGEAGEVKAALARVRAELPPVRGVLHAAGVVRDGLLARQDATEIMQVLHPKVLGAWAVEAGLAGAELDWWIDCSSAAGLVGQAGQAGYAGANAVLDALAQAGQGRGVARLSINWGPIGGGGMAAEAGRGVQAAWAAAGVKSLALGAVGPTLAAAWAQGQAQLAAIAWGSRAGPANPTDIPTILSQLVEATPKAQPVVGARPGDGSLSEALMQASDRQRTELLLQTLQGITAELLELPAGVVVAPERPLRELGLDSLLAVELRNRLARQLGRPLPATLLFDYPTLARLAAHLIAEVLALGPVAPADVQPAPLATTLTEPIAIVGLGCRFPGGADSPEAFWRLLRDGVDAIEAVPPDRWDVDAFYDPDPDAPGKMNTRWGAFLQNIDRFDAAFFRIVPREAAAMDPQQRLLLEVSWEALERAGVAPTSLAGSKTGVFVGISTTDYAQLQTMSGNAGDIDIYFGTGSAVSVAAGRLSYVLGLQGPSMAIDTACSSALVAVHLACQSLRSGECQLALAGGVNAILTPMATINFSRAQMMAPDGRCKAFDARADGYVRGEGCGVVVLKRLADAERDGDPIWAVVRGSAVNQDGRSNGLTAPNGPAQEAVIRAALQQAGAEPAEIGYVEAHGTGTPLGDPIEVQALTSVLSAGRPADRPLLVGSVKTNVGHLEAAAGMAGLIKTVLALQQQTIPAHLHFQVPNPHIPWKDIPLAIPTQTVPWPAAVGPRLAGVSAFGVSGTNAHVVLAEAQRAGPRPEADLTSADRPRHLLGLSARSPEALRQTASRWADFLGTNPTAPLADVCFTAGAGRTHFDHRLAIIADTTGSAREKLIAFAQGEAARELWHGQPGEGKAPRVAFLFTGQGGQFAGLGRQLYATQPTFRRALDRCGDALSSLLDRPLLELLYGPTQATALLAQTRYAQPVLFALEWALAELWESWGVAPGALLGHSLGEYVAACQAGVFSLEDGLRLVVARGQMMETTGPGAMLAVFASAERIAPAIANYNESVSVAAINGPTEAVIAGPRDVVDTIRQSLVAAGISCRPLPVSYAFHSPLVDPVLDTLADAAAVVDYQPPQLTVVSNLTGAAAVDGELTTAAYWRRQAREPVRFGEGLESLRAMGYNLFIEVGPQSTLLRLGQRLNGAENATWLPTLDPQRDDWSQLLESMGRLYVAGVDVDWQAFDRDYQRSRVVLPTYPFQRERYWFKQKPPLPAASPPARRSLLGRRLSSPVMKDVIFEALNSADSPAFLADHRIGQTVVMPGAGYALMMLAAARQALHSLEIDLTEMTFTEALTLPDGQARTTQVIVTPDGASSALIQIFSRPDNWSDDTPWTLHARATARLLKPEAEVVQPLSAESIEARCTEAIAGADFYALAGERGMNFGPHFRWIEQIRRGTHEAIGHLRPARPADTLDDCPLPPGLVDACFQLLAAAAPAGPDQSVAIPVGFDRLRLLNSAEGPLWGYAKVSAADHPDQRLMAGDVQLFGSLGPVLEIEALRIVHVPRSSLIAETIRPDWLYELAWTAVDRTVAAPVVAATAGTWLILADQSGCADKLARLLEEHGQRCVMIVPGDSCRAEGDRRWSVAPGRREDFAYVLRAALPEGERWRGAVHLWGFDTAASDLDTISTAQELICASALHLTQALAATNGTPRLWIVTAGAQSLEAAPEKSAPLQATLWGFGRTLAAEQPELWGGLIDLDPGEPDFYAANVLNELLATDAERQVAFRRGQRYAARLERLAATDQGARSVPLRLRADGVYLITGGLGGLGLQLARRLAERGARHIVLVGRNDPTKPAQAVIQSIEATGVQVLVLRADVAHESELVNVLARIAQELPPLRGVIHAAGVLDDGVLSKQTWTRFANVLRPKLDGAWNLHTLTRAIPLDFFVLFSSAAALLGSPGQASYAAANAFLDALAHRRRALGLPALSVNWGPWAGAGMTGPSDTARRWAAVGLSPIDPDRGLDTLEYLLQRPELVQVAVLPVNWPQFAQQLPGGVPPLFAAFTRPGGEQEQIVTDPERRDFLNRLLATTPERRQDLLAAHVRAQVLAVLNMAATSTLNLNQGLFEMGMDSLTALEVRNHLQQSLGLALPATVVFEHSTVLALATYLNEALAPSIPTEAAHPEADDLNPELASLLAEIEELSEGEVDRALSGLTDEQLERGHSE